jgi:hypothetical protein
MTILKYPCYMNNLVYWFRTAVATMLLLAVSEAVAQSDASQEWRAATTLYVSGVDTDSDAFVEVHMQGPLYGWLLRKSWCIWRQDSGTAGRFIFVTDLCDTLINGRTYSLVRADGIPERMAYRQDGQRVYRYDSENQMDVLMLDYSLDVGDEVTVDGNLRLRVEAEGPFEEITRHFLYGNVDVPRGDVGRMLRLRGMDDPDYEDVWVEGVGSIHSGILSHDAWDGRSDLHLLYGMIGHDQKQMPNAVASFAIDTETFKARPFLSSAITFTELDSMRARHDGRSEWLEYERVGDSLHVVGCLSLDTNSPYAMCGLLSDDSVVLCPYRLETSIFSSNHFYCWVDVTLPAFHATVSKLVYFDADRQVEVAPMQSTGIDDGAAFQHKKIKTPAFDLQGRPVTTPPTRGIYIKDGKKYYVK